MVTKKALKQIRARSQATLFGQTFGQMLRVKELRNEVEQLERELDWISFVRSNEMAMIEVVICIERYLGSRLPWFLNVQNLMCHIDCGGDPLGFDPRNYEIGYYGNDNTPGTRKFINDQLQWAEVFIQNELRQKQVELKIVSAKKEW